MVWPFRSRAREISNLEFELRKKELTDRLAGLSTAAVQNAGTASIGLSNPNAWFDLFGPPVSSVSAATALKHAAVYRCVFLIAGSASMLDLKCYNNYGKVNQSEDTDSNVARLLRDRPNPRYSCEALWRSVYSDMLLSGNGVVWIERNGDGSPRYLWYIPWQRVGVYFFVNPLTGGKELAYNLTLDSGEVVRVPQDDVLHNGGSHRWNLLFFESPLTSYAQTVGIAINGENFAEAYYKNGAVFDGVVTFPNAISDNKAQEFRARLSKRFNGSNAFNGPLMLDSGGTFTQLKVNAADAQIIETRGFGVDQIGMVFGVPAHLLNRTDKATSFGKGLEELTQSFLDFSVGPHLRAAEGEINWKLFGQRHRRAVYDRDSFVRGDLKSRAEALQTLLGGAQGPGSISRNEARAKLGMPPLEGDDYDEVLGWGNNPADPANPVPTPEPPESPAAPEPPSTPKPNKRSARSR